MVFRPLSTVGGLIVAPDQEILLVRSKKWRDLYSIPGGKVEWGETCEAALKREIWEETALNVTNVRFALVQESILSSEFWEEAHFIMHDFIADLDPSSKKEHVHLNPEADYFCWVTPSHALTLPLHRECRFLIEWYLASVGQKAMSSNGVIGIDQLQIPCIIGIHSQERQMEQCVIVDLKIQRDWSQCVASGSIQDTLDYCLLAELCTTLAQQKKYFLLETFATEILDQCMDRFNPAWVWVRIQKPSAIPSARSAYVELERCREREKPSCGL
jgi:dihydroneopterin aldolase